MKFTGGKEGRRTNYEASRESVKQVESKHCPGSMSTNL